MSWVKEDYEYTLLQRVCMNLLKRGKVPKHIAFIMDGNRRYAAKNSLRSLEGHSLGFKKLSETLQWCRDLNIKEASFFAFSIHNFKRESEEVNYLMDLARDKIKKLMEEKKLLEKYEIHVRFIGNLSLLPEDIQNSIREVLKLTKQYNKFYLNICMAYTSHDEICHSLNIIREGVQKGLILQSDINQELISQCLYLSDSKVDLLIRTSGETRLSDFLMWQCSEAYVQFIDSYWPDFNVWHLFMSIFQYQKSCIMNVANSVFIQPICKKDAILMDKGDNNKRVNRFLDTVKRNYENWLENSVNNGYFY